MAMIFITHDLGVMAGDRRPRRSDVRWRTVEAGHVEARCSRRRCIPTRSAWGDPGSTLRPVAARPPGRQIPGMVPPLNALPQGCAFAPRCTPGDGALPARAAGADAAGARIGLVARSCRRAGSHGATARPDDVHVHFPPAGGLVRANGVSLGSRGRRDPGPGGAK